MPTGLEALLVLAGVDRFPLYVPYYFPTLRACRELRSNFDGLHLRGALYARQCPLCDRYGKNKKTFVFVQEDVSGNPLLYTCYLCKRCIWPED